MGKTIIVMRHGKAKRIAEGQEDISRELTEAGVRSLRATLGDSLALWPAGAKRAEVWASPAARAQQTAELLAEALRDRGVKGVRNVKTVESLWTGDQDALLQEVRTADADTIALVGHNPFSEELVQDLTGSDIRFATGALAAVRLSDQDDAPTLGAEPEPAGRLLWFAQGPVSQRWKTLVTMEKVLASAADTVQQRYDEFFADPDDIETMHALRVSIRTARSLSAFVKPWQDEGQNAQVQDDLRAVVAITSRQRELDVMWEQVQESEDFSPDLAHFCAEQAAAERARVLKALSTKQVRKQLDRARKNLASVRWKRSYAAAGLGASEVRSRFDRMAGKLEANLSDLDLAEVERTHDVRKQAKRVRYSAERFKDILGDDAIGIAKSMVAHQDDLGAICDARVNIDIINSLAESDVPEAVGWELALLRARYETFLYSLLRDSHSQQGQQDQPGQLGQQDQPQPEGAAVETLESNPA